MLRVSIVTCFCLLKSNMEETVRTLLQNHDSLEGPKVDPLDLMKAYKVKTKEKKMTWYNKAMF